MANIFNISSASPFLDELALGLIERFPNLQDVTVFLPTKRAIYGLQQALAKNMAGKVGFLPQIEALGDVDEDEFILHGFPHIERLPKAVSQNSRLLKITKMIMARQKDKRLNAAQALKISQELCRLLDEFYNRNADFAELKNIVPDDFSEHWAKTLEFLDVVVGEWQEYKRKNSLLDEVERRNLLLLEVAKYWREFPPEKPIVIAGTTATIPATQELIASVCGNPNGHLVVYGMDAGLDYEELEATHPQYNLAQLLLALGLPEVAAWGGEKASSRQALLSTALLPKTRVEEWQDFVAVDENLELVECKNAEEEASVIALILREAVANKERAALVTNNKTLAKRVQNKLGVWGLVATNSHSKNLEESDLGQFLLLLAEMFSSCQQPAKLLAFFKHKFVREDLREQVYKIEKSELRGLRPDDFCISEHMEFKAFAPVKELFDGEMASLENAMQAMMLLAEEVSGGAVWSESDAAEVEQVNSLLAEISGFGEVDTLLIPDMLSQLLAIQSVGFAAGVDSGIEILSLIESRFTAADLVIMSGLNEGDFPSISGGSDLLNQQMRRKLGLDLPERKIGQQAHDFELLSQAKRVVYTRAKKDAGTPTVASRFVQALSSLIALKKGEKYTGWLAQMRAAEHVVPCVQPEPRPPLSARPQKLAVTKIEQLMRDPYVIYASKVLGLYKEDDLDAEITPADFGNFVHLALEKYDAVYDGTLETLLACAEDVLRDEYQDRRVLRVFWLPRFAKIADWVLVKEREARGSGAEILSEFEAEIELGSFVLTARADRLEKSSQGIKIIDYKTGAMPSDKDVKQGVSPQVSLEALIFSHKFEIPILACEFWQTKGLVDDKIHVLKEDMEQLIEEAYEGCTALIERFADEQTPYIARPRPQVALAYNNYAHLARIQEWE